DDGLAAADDAVHTGRLADVGTADDGEDGQRALPGLLDHALHVLDVEALFAHPPHELRVLRVTAPPVAALLARALGVDAVAHEVRTSFIVVIGGTPLYRVIHYSSVTQRPVRRLAFSRCAVSCFWMRSVASSSALRVRRPLPSPASKGSPKTTSTRERSGGSAFINRPGRSELPRTATGTMGAPPRTAK